MLIKKFAKLASQEYQQILDSPLFLDIVNKATLYPYLNELKFGSRPAKRSGNISINNIEDIPKFSIRSMIIIDIRKNPCHNEDRLIWVIFTTGISTFIYITEIHDYPHQILLFLSGYLVKNIKP